MKTFNCDLGIYKPNFNAFPGANYPIYIGNRETIPMAWGYYYPKLKSTFLDIPVSNKIIYDKRFQISIRKQRCIIPANCVSLNFNGRRFLIYDKGSRLFGMAGMYSEYWNEKILCRTFAVLSRPSTGLFAALGNKEEPIILDKHSYSRWLKPDGLSQATYLIECENHCEFEALPIVSLMNDISQNSKEVLTPIGDPLSGPVFKDTFFKNGNSGISRRKKNSVIRMSLEERIKGQGDRNKNY